MVKDFTDQTAGTASADVAGESNSGGTVLSFTDLANLALERWRLLVLGPLCAGLAALGLAYQIPPTFTASTIFMPPQQGQSAAASALASLGPLAGFAGGAPSIRNTGEQYVALMQSVTVADRLVEQFKLMEIYDAKYRVDARTKLAKNVRIALGKKDGLITVEVDDKSPQRAADIANRYVDELRRITGTLALTEAQQRRAFFERHLQSSRDRLTQAQQALEASGFSPGALKAEPKAAAEAYARLKAEVTAAELRLGLVRTSLADATPEVKQQLATVASLRDQLVRTERATDMSAGPGYVGKYREFKYQEAVFDAYARQFELARADESREGSLIQVVDLATPPERKSKPKRAMIAAATTLAVAVLLLSWVLVRQSMRHRSAGKRAQV